MILWYDFQMTSKNTPPPFIVTESSVYQDSASYKSWKLFDGKTGSSTNRWIANSPRAWSTVYFGTSKFFNYIEITARDGGDANNFSPKDFKLLGSNNNNDWDILLNATNIFWSSLESKIFKLSISSNKKYLYYKIDVSSTGNGTSVVSFDEMRFGVDNSRLLLKNTTTLQNYSLSNNTLIHLPDASNKNMILYGIEQGEEIQLDTPFTKVKHPSFTNEVLGKGKLFKTTINTQIPIKNIAVEQE